jgi:hypothetical protein
VRYRLWLSQLADGAARSAASRWLLALCALGFVVTVVLLAGLGYGLDRAGFAFVVWAALIFIPLRIALEASGPAGARARERLAARAVADPARYARPDLVGFVVRDLLARTVTMPRITTPVHRQKARVAATAILSRLAARRAPADLLRDVIRTTLAAASDEAAHVSAGATGTAADAIQARWEGARALGAVSALVSVLAAAYADQHGVAPALPELGGRTLADFLDATMDYCDEAALQVDALPWTEPPLARVAPAEKIDAVRAAWRAFLDAGTPAPRALEAFLATVLPSARAPGPD